MDWAGLTRHASPRLNPNPNPNPNLNRLASPLLQCVLEGRLHLEEPLRGRRDVLREGRAVGERGPIMLHGQAVVGAPEMLRQIRFSQRSEPGFF